MRPKLLEIEGLQSFRERQRIDFEVLGETGLFGIFGPTGSGKSTVLDAITFALYGRVKRAERGTQGIINTNMSIAKVSFTFELLKNGIRKSYRVERTYQRKKGSVNACEPKVARLIEINGEDEVPICDKASEVSSSVEELIGLNHDDFTRAVVLPQNSFQEFLMLDSSKKRDMLERIFYLDEYGRKLWDKLNRKQGNLKSRLDTLAGELAGYGDATAEALEEAQKSLDIAAVEKEKAEKELKQLEARHAEAKEIWQLVKDLAVFEERENQLVLRKDEMERKKESLEYSIKAEAVIDIISRSRDLFTRLENTKTHLSQLIASMAAKHESLEAAKLKYEGLKKDIKEQQPRLVEQRARLADALVVKNELDQIHNRISNLQDFIDRLKTGIEQKNLRMKEEENQLKEAELKLDQINLQMEALKTSPEYRQELQAASKLELEVEAALKNVTEAEANLSTIKAAVIELEQSAEGLNKELELLQASIDDAEAEINEQEALKPGSREEMQKFLDEAGRIRNCIDILQIRYEEKENVLCRMEAITDRKKSLWQVAENLRQVRDSAAEYLEKCRQRLEQANLERDKNAAFSLSAGLVDGEPCPVCGSRQHPAPALAEETREMSALEQQVEEAKAGVADAEKSLRDADLALLAAEEQVRSADEQLEAVKKELDKKKVEYDNQKLKLPEALREKEQKELRPEIDKIEAQAGAKMEALVSWEKKSEEYKIKLQELKIKQTEEKLREKEISTKLKVSNANMAQAQKVLEVNYSALEDKKRGYTELLQRLNIESASAEHNRIMEKDRKTALLQKDAEELRVLMSEMKAEYEKVRVELEGLLKDEVRLNSDFTNLSQQALEKESKLREMAGETDIESEIRSIELKLDEFNVLDKRYQEEVQELEKHYNELITEKSTLENQYEIYSRDYGYEGERLKAALKINGFNTIDEVEGHILAKEARTSLSEEINQYDKEWNNIQAQKSLFEKKLNERHITEEEWNGINAAYVQLAADKEECVSHFEVAKNNLSNVKRKHEKWQELNNRNMELTKQYGLLETIGRLLKSERGKDNSFIDYIAEERLSYVAAKASEILGSITRYKYALELDTDAGFIIRDYANGGVHRMVNSLSGGETFLTSLSLALALSEQIQLKGQSPLEFFFLDEGFGTLDTGLLDTVIDSLERLSSKERVIGLISHVPELKGRIARRLVINPPTMQETGSRVCIEKA